MFITRRRLEEIKSHEREMSELWTRLHELEHKVAMLENTANAPTTTEGVITTGTPIIPTSLTFV